QHDHPAEALRLAPGSQHADHSAYGMPYEDDVAQLQRMDHFQHVLSIAFKIGISERVVSRHIGFPAAYIIKKHDAVVILESRGYMPPHCLVATEAMREQHG